MFYTYITLTILTSYLHVCLNKCLCFSGVKIEFDLKQNPGHRVSSLLLRCGHCSVPKFEPLVLTANYTIVMSNYLAEGGNNFKAFKKILKKNELLGE